MKMLIFFIFLFPIGALAKTISINVTDIEISIVEHDVIDASQWLQDAWNGKVNNCKKRLVKEEVDKSIKNKESIPAGDDAIVQKAMSRPDYKNRKQRDLEEIK